LAAKGAVKDCWNFPNNFLLHWLLSSFASSHSVEVEEVRESDKQRHKRHKEGTRNKTEKALPFSFPRQGFSFYPLIEQSPLGRIRTASSHGMAESDEASAAELLNEKTHHTALDGTQNSFDL
jgi:hypothetical protein